MWPEVGGENMTAGVSIFAFSVVCLFSVLVILSRVYVDCQLTDAQVRL